MKNIRVLPTGLVAVISGCVLAVTGFGGLASAAGKSLVVCKKGCQYSSLQKAVKAAKKGATIKIKPGRYLGGAMFTGHSKDGIRILGLGKKPTDTVLDGKGVQGLAAQNGIFADGVDNVKFENLTAKNFVANGFFVRNGKNYLMKNLFAYNNKAYGLYAFNCVGGRMTKSKAARHGDSGFYVGQTAPQAKPKRTVLDHVEAYENVIGYSGTNSRYVDVRDSEFYNNGVGVFPNTLDTEKFEPASDSTFKNNLIYWNNFNYFKKSSPVSAVPNGLGPVNYPTGIGVVLFGTTGIKLENNTIFGNFKFGSVVISLGSPINEDSNGDGLSEALAKDNQLIGNKVGVNPGGQFDPNGQADFWYEGTGSGNCFQGNVAATGKSVVFDPGTIPTEQLYPLSCAVPVVNVPGNTQGGTGAFTRDNAQYDELANYITLDVAQENFWIKAKHPAFKQGRKPIDGLGG